jgi:hypothetical protein
MNKPSKHQIDYALRVTRSKSDSFNKNKASQYFADYNYGIINEGKHHIDRKSKDEIKTWLESHGINWLTHKINDKSRIGVSSQQINEKQGAALVKETWIKIKSLTGVNQINDIPIQVPKLSHIEISKDDISSTNTEALILIENLEPFKVASSLAITGLPNHSMAVYRGDNESGMAYSWIKSVIEALPQTKLITFADFDPAGIDIAMGAKSSAIILPCLDSLKSIQGSKEDYSNQLHQLHQRMDSSDIPPPLLPWTEYLLQTKEGYTQERMISEGVKFQVLWLHSENCHA